MNAAQPLALVLVALAVPTVAAYLHRRKRQTKTVPSALLFRVIAGDNTPTRRSMAQPRHLVSLVLIVLALLTMVLAVVDLRDESSEPRDYIVVLDTSASMGAHVLGDEATRLDAARERLDTALEAMGPGDRVALITSGETTAVRIGLTEDYARVRALAAEQTPAGASEGMPRALRIADAMARGNDATVVVVSDGVGVGVPAMDRMPQLVGVGQPGPNVGINALAVREADSLGLTEVFVSVSGDIQEDREVEVTLRVDDAIVDVIPLTISTNGPTPGHAETLHRVALPEGTSVIATLQNHGDDVLAADDVAISPRRAGDRVRVLLVAKSRISFSAEALRLHPRVDLTIIGPYDSAPHPAYDLMILETDHRGGGLPQAPRILAFGTDPASLPGGALPAGKRIASPRILRWSFDDPIFRFVDLTDMDLPRARVQPDLAEDMTSLIDAENGSLAVRVHRDDADVVYFGFSPAESDLVLRVGFVNLVANAVEWGAPVADGDGTGASTAQVLPSTETLLDPQTSIPGTILGDFDRKSPADRPLWQWLVFFAAGLMVAEGLLPGGRRVVSRGLAVWRRRTKKGAGA